MTIQPTVFVKDYSVFNPNFIDDVIKFMCLNRSRSEVTSDIDLIDKKYPLNREQIKAGAPTLKERLNALIDRIEFIDHLDIVRHFAAQSGEVLGGQEVHGLQADIKALRLYLALASIDIFHEDVTKQTKEHFQTTFSNAPQQISKNIRDNLRLLLPNGSEGSLADIGSFFYSVRNYYTHAGRRFHIMPGISFEQMTTFLSGTKKIKEEQILLVGQKCDLVALIKSLALHLAKRRFEWTKE